MGLTNSQPLRCIGVQVFSLGIGVALGAMVIPAGCTHVFAAPAGGENSQSIWMQLTVAGSANTAAFPLGSSTGIAGFPEQPIPLPVNTSITGYNFRRNVTTAAIDYVVFYYKQG